MKTLIEPGCYALITHGTYVGREVRVIKYHIKYPLSFFSIKFINYHSILELDNIQILIEPKNLMRIDGYDEQDLLNECMATARKYGYHPPRPKI